MQTIYLDISNRGTYPCIYAKQSEVGRKFLAVITDNGVPYNIPDNSLLSVWYEGDTDAGNYSSIEENSAFGIDGNKVTVELVAQMLLKPGNGELCLSITHGDGGETNTWNIPYCVEYKPGAGSAVPTEYYTALTEAGSVAARYATEAANSAAEAEETLSTTLKKDGTIAMTGNLNVGGNRVVNVANPNLDTDATNKGFVDGKLSQFDEQVRELLNETVAQLKNAMHPIGSVYISTDSTNPGATLGGTWERIQDTFLLASGEKFVAGSVGGSETHTLTVDELPAHSHNGNIRRNIEGHTEGQFTDVRALDDMSGVGESSDEQLTYETGGGQAFGIMPPYLAVYVWKRTA